MQDSDHDDSASAIADAEGPGPQETGAPDAEDKPFRPVSQMSAREWEQAAREVNRLYPRINRRYS